MKNLSLSMLFLTLVLGVVSAQDQITVSGDSGVNSIAGQTPEIVAPNLAITSNGDITDFTVTITDSYSTSDQLGYSTSLPSGVTSTGWNATTRSIVFKGTLESNAWQSFLRNVNITTGVICSPETRKVSFVAGDTYYNPINDHFYKVTSIQDSWSNTKTASESLSYYGQKGYLATITNEAENTYVYRLIGQNAWMGASDDYQEINEALGYTLYNNQTEAEGKWYWVTGPEKGTQMSTANQINIPSVYENWNSGEPNNSGSEHALHMYSSTGLWNDFPNSFSIVGIIEFGNMPGDLVTSTPQFTKNVQISGASSGTITGGDVSVCSGSNSTTLTLSGFTGTVVRWESSVDNFITTGTTVSNTTTTLQVNNISETTYYRAVVNSTAPSVCNGLVTSSTPIRVTGLVTGNVFAENTSICANNDVDLYVSGNEGQVQKWQRSTDDSNWVDIANTTTTLTETIASAGTMYYRAVIEDVSCGASDFTPSKEIAIVNGTPPVGGSVDSNNHTSPTNSGTLTLTGHTGTITKWQQSVDGGLVWTDISNTTTTYAYNNIATTTQFRVQVANGSCGSEFSIAGAVNISNPLPIFTSPSGAFNVSAAVYSSNSANVVSELSSPYGIAFNDDGTKMFVSGIFSSEIAEYTLSTAYDVSTASYVDSLTGMSGRTTGINFNNDGTKIYYASANSGNNITAYSLSSAYDISTASFLQTYSATQGSSYDDVTFNGDGSKMFLLAYNNDYIYEYNLGTPFDISTAVYTNNSFEITEDNNPQEVDFNGDGSQLFVITIGGELLAYNLATPYDLSTISFSGIDFDTDDEEGNPYGLAFSADGTKFFTIGFTKRVHEYQMQIVVPFDENVTSMVADCDANDGEGGASDAGITYSLASGGDNDLFSIDSASGVLSFQAAPDFETPGDANADNDYEITVIATDSDGSTNLNLTVSVADVDEDAPTGYTVVIDQNPITLSNQNDISFTFSNAEVDATYDYTFSSDGGGTNATGSGTILTVTDQITTIDLEALEDGVITLTVTLTDEAGNEGPEVSDSSDKDTEAPTATIASTLDVYLDANGQYTVQQSDIITDLADNTDPSPSVDLTNNVFDCTHIGASPSWEYDSALIDADYRYAGVHRHNGTVYMSAYNSTDNLELLSWNGTSWNSIATSSFTITSPYSQINLTVDKNNNFLMATIIDYKLTIFQYNGSAWSELVSASVNSTYNVGSIYEAVASSVDPITNDIWWVYTPSGSAGGTYRVNALKWDGSSLVHMGYPSQTGMAYPGDWTNNPDIDFLSTGIPVVVYGYRNYVNDSRMRTTVVAYEGGNWVDKGAINSDITRTYDSHIEVTPDDRVYVAYRGIEANNGGLFTTTDFATWTPVVTQNATPYQYSIQLYDAPNGSVFYRWASGTGSSSATTYLVNGTSAENISDGATLFLNMPTMTYTDEDQYLMFGGTPYNFGDPLSFYTKSSLGVNYTITDSHGNENSGRVGVIIHDNLDPVVVTQDVTLILDASGDATLTAAEVDNGSTDNCQIDEIILDQTSFDFSHLGDNTVQLTVTDINGNSTSAPATVTVQDNIAPSGYTVSIDQTTIDSDNQDSVSFTFTDAEVGATFDYSFTSDGGGIAVTGTGTIVNVSQVVSNIDLSSLTDGTITLSVSLTDPSDNEGPDATDTVVKEVDTDGDGIADGLDNCPLVSNPDQTNTDGLNDGGDACDEDDDEDGTLDVEDAFPLDPNEDTDTDGDGTGDNTDSDDDNDGTTDSEDAFPLDSNEDTDTDGDGTGDNADLDDDNDNTPDTEDDFPLDPTEDTDTDGDGLGNNTDDDDDNDGILDSEDEFPLDDSEGLDTDGDGIGDGTDDDDDNDGTLDSEDDFPLDPTEDTDTDGDGQGDNVDGDDDNDGFSDTVEANQGSDSSDPDSVPIDSDGDGVSDILDDDDDNDGISDSHDEFPLNSTPQVTPAEAFTPNGDGMNDAWVVPGIDNYPHNVVRVYNRWGHEVFAAGSYQNNWEGFYKDNSEKLPAGSYMYVIDLGNGTPPIQGWIYINY